MATNNEKGSVRWILVCVVLLIFAIVGYNSLTSKIDGWLATAANALPPVAREGAAISGFIIKGPETRGEIPEEETDDFDGKLVYYDDARFDFDAYWPGGVETNCTWDLRMFEGTCIRTDKPDEVGQLRLLKIVRLERVDVFVGHYTNPAGSLSIITIWVTG